MPRLGRAVLATVLAVAAGGAVWAQATDDPAPILHEYVAPPRPAAGGGASDEAPKTIGGEPRAGKNPAAVRAGDKLVPEPSKAPQPAQREPVHGTRDFGADRETQASPDRVTGADGTLHYVEVFNPSVVPFKRMSALDGVRDDYVLRVHDARLTDVPVGGKTRPDRDPFWGSLLVDLSPGEDVPIPSVAPDMRILSYEVDPPLELRFSKDGADNYYVRTDDRSAGGTYRLVFLVDSPAVYFAPRVPPGYGVSDATASGLVHPLPPGVKAAAARVHRKLGVSPNMPLDRAVNRLVEYFRGFEAGTPPPPTDDIYLDLALSKVGVCRHRAFAFAITAQALGIPARYVTNEAHAFAEVWAPEVGWLRVDLGGAALNLDVANAGNKQMYNPRGDDPFPKPPEYADNYTQLRGDIRGLTQDQIDQARGDGAGGGGPGSGDPGGGDQDAGPGPARPPGSTAPVAPTPGTGLPLPPASAYQGKTPSRITVDRADGSGFRGESLHAGGRVTSESGKPLAGVPVNVYLAPAGAGGDGARLLGETYTDADGVWETTVDLPRDLLLGRHEVFASTPGDTSHQPALSK
jgi:hypothetical protein